MRKYFFLLLLVNYIFLSAKAQNKGDLKGNVNWYGDSIILNPLEPKAKPDHKKYHPDSLHSPHTAVICSLILPGLGQVYNHQLWKVPIIYTALSLLGDAIVYNQHYYKEFLALSIYKEKGKVPMRGDKYYNEYLLLGAQQPQTIYNIKDAFRRDRDLSIMGFATFWGVQLVDAYIDAKFKHSYTMDTDLSYNIGPTIINQQPVYAQSLNSSIIPGIKLTFTLK